MSLVFKGWRAKSRFKGPTFNRRGLTFSLFSSFPVYLHFFSLFLLLLIFPRFSPFYLLLCILPPFLFCFSLSLSRCILLFFLFLCFWFSFYPSNSSFLLFSSICFFSFSLCLLLCLATLLLPRIIRFPLVLFLYFFVFPLTISSFFLSLRVSRFLFPVSYGSQRARRLSYGSRGGNYGGSRAARVISLEYYSPRVA